MCRHRSLIALLLAAAAASHACSAPAPVPILVGGQPQPLDGPIDWGRCDVRIAFGSFATGPDRAAVGAIERELRSDPSVLDFSRSPAGPEGEQMLCARTAAEADATRVGMRLIQAVSPPTSAPVTIYTRAWRHRFPTR